MTRVSLITTVALFGGCACTPPPTSSVGLSVFSTRVGVCAQYEIDTQGASRVTAEGLCYAAVDMTPTGAVVTSTGEPLLALIPFSHSSETPSIRSLDGGVVKTLPSNSTTFLGETSGVLLISSIEGVFAASTQGWEQLQGREAGNPSLYAAGSAAVGVAPAGSMLKWYLYEPTRASLVRSVSGDRVFDATQTQLLAGNSVGELNLYGTGGTPRLVPGSSGCIWGESVVSLSANGKTLLHWADGGVVASRDLAFKIDRLSCGCARANRFVAESFETNRVYSMDQSLNDTPLEVPTGGPGEWLLTRCQDTE